MLSGRDAAAEALDGGGVAGPAASAGERDGRGRDVGRRGESVEERLAPLHTSVRDGGEERAVQHVAGAERVHDGGRVEVPDVDVKMPSDAEGAPVTGDE